MAPKIIDNAGKKKINGLLTRARVRESIYVETTLHTAYLAALQVIDKRVKFLEEGKEDTKQDKFSVEDLLLDILLDLVLSGVAGKVLEIGVEGLIRPLIRSRQAYYVIPKIKIKKKKIKIVGASLSPDRLKAARQKAKTKLQNHFNRIANSEEFSAFNGIAAAIRDSTLEVASDEARSAINLPKSAGPPTTGSSSSSQTPVVEILSAIFGRYQTQKRAVEVMYADLKEELDYSEIPEETATEWQSFLQENTAGILTSSEELDKFNKQMILLYEMSMWAYLFDVDALTSDEPGDAVHQVMSSSPKRAIINRLEDPRNFEMKKKSDEAVTYQMPELFPARSGYADKWGHVKNVKRTIKIPKQALDYWIDRFPYRDGDLSGPTVFEFFDREYGKGEQKKRDGTLIKAYDAVLKKLRRRRLHMKESKRNLVAGGLGSG